MNKQKTIQIISNKKPIGKDLAITLFCVDCNTLRSFNVLESINAILDRKTGGLKISSFCEKCKREIGFSLFWTNLTKGYSYRTQEVEGNSVIDFNGLIRLEDE